MKSSRLLVVFGQGLVLVLSLANSFCFVLVGVVDWFVLFSLLVVLLMFVMNLMLPDFSLPYSKWIWPLGNFSLDLHTQLGGSLPNNIFLLLFRLHLLLLFILINLSNLILFRHKLFLCLFLN